jgi:hypothetical protein
MGYRQRLSPTIGLGCLPAAVLGFFLGAPAAFGIIMGECVDESGRVGNCPNEGVLLLATVATTAALCLLVTWATNRMASACVERERAAGWGVAGGFVLAAALFGTVYGLLLALT